MKHTYQLRGMASQPDSTPIDFNTRKHLTENWITSVFMQVG